MPSPAQHYAHSLSGKPVEQWHRLDEHLTETASMAAKFSRDFGSGWGYLAGLWHDLGKYQAAFQRRIGADPNAHTDERVDHSSIGALLAQEKKLHPLTFVIAGHHGGLCDKQDLIARLRQKKPLLQVCRSEGLPDIHEVVDLPEAPGFLGADQRKFALWIRFLFSALVDADFLNTESFYQGSLRKFEYATIPELRQRLVQYLDQKASAAPATTMNELRARIRAACRQSALLEPGAYTLTAPTGGGKTLSSMQFALDHAVEHGMRRIIVVIPYTSIIDQTAKQYQAVFGEQNVIEHHSGVDPDIENRLNRLAAENWDAPIIVTTSVQFFESLYANRPSRCRKLHRIAKSVVILDEVQTVPAGLLEPIRDVLRQLISDYGVTCLLCTATQPALISGAREILPDVKLEFERAKNRCHYNFPATMESVSWEKLATDIARYPQVLTIVNKRDDAYILAKLLGENAIHLSARMCPAHRKHVIENIKQERLPRGANCCVVSTQLIEAGVDVDFPVVFRALAGADSLAQAAGRCNREGLHRRGDVFIFKPPSDPPRGLLRQAAQRTEGMWKEGRMNLHDSETFVEYLRRFYSTVETDPGVLKAEKELCFLRSAQLFKMIDEVGCAVVAPYADWKTRIDEIRRTGMSRYALRRLQPYFVNLYPQEVSTLKSMGALEEIDSGSGLLQPVTNIFIVNASVLYGMVVLLLKPASYTA